MSKPIYISIPRTGSHSIHELIDQKKTNNHKARRLIKAQGKSFAFVRNPYDLAISWFYFHKQNGYSKIYECTFSEWVFAGLPTHWSDELCSKQGVTYPLTQFEYVCDLEGKIIVDFIGRFENLQDDFNNVFGKILPLQKINSAQRGNWENEYTLETLEIVGRKFKKDFELFNYINYKNV